jgi:predicted permease
MMYDLRVIARKTRKDFALTAAKLIMFAIGIGGGTVFFSLSDGLNNIQRLYPNGGRIVAIGTANEYGNSDVTTLSYKTYDYIKDAFPFLQQFANFTLASQTIQDGGHSEVVQGSWVTPNLFHLLGTRLELGELMQSPNMYWRDYRWILITHELWQNKFGSDRQIVGKVLHVDGRAHAVLGVLPKGFKLPGDTSSYPPQYFVPFQVSDVEPANLELGIYRVLALNAGKMSISALQHEISANTEAQKREGELNVVALRDIMIGRSLREKIWLLNDAAAFLVCLAIANISLLCLAQAVAWKKEFAVMSAMGASFLKLVKVLLLENIVQVLLAAPIGVLVSINIQKALIASIPENLGLVTEINLRVFLGIAAVCLLFCFVASVLPVLRLWKADVWANLQPQTQSIVTPGGFRNRAGISWLVAGEVTLVCIFMFVSGLLLLSQWRRDSVRRGPYVDRISMFTAKIKPEKYAKREDRVQMFQNIETNLNTIPGVESVGITGFVIPDETRPRQEFWKESDNLSQENQSQIVYRSDASLGYFDTLGIRLLRGRPFDSGDREQPGHQVVLISQETARRYWPNEDPIGKRIRISKATFPPSEIIGVTEDMISAGQNPQPLPMAWRPQTGRPFDSSTYIVRMAPGAALRRDSIEKAISSLDNEVLIYGPHTLRKDITDFQWEARFLALVYAFFGAVVLLLSVLGVYSIVLYSTKKKLPEFALRKALGASRTSLIALLCRAGAMNVAVGSVAGLAIGILFSFKLGSFLYHTSPTELKVVLATMVLAFCAAFAGYCRPAVEVIKSDPLKILRS